MPIPIYWPHYKNIFSNYNGIDIRLANITFMKHKHRKNNLTHENKKHVNNLLILRAKLKTIK
jgi:hypothetical protein